MINQFKLARTLLVTSMLLCFVLFTMAFYIPEPPREEEPLKLICGNIFFEMQQPTDEVYLAGERLFKANCTSCHQMHKKVIGPALVDVFERRDSLWVVAATLNYQALMEKGDQTAIDLYKAYNGTQHVIFESFTDKEVNALMNYLRNTVAY